MRKKAEIIKLMESVNLEKCKEYLMKKYNDFHHITEKSINERLSYMIKIYLQNEYIYILDDLENKFVKDLRKYPKSYKLFKAFGEAQNQVAKTILVKIKRQPLEQINELVYNLDLDKCEEHAIEYCKKVYSDYLTNLEKRVEIISELHFMENGVYDYLMKNYYKKIGQIQVQNFIFLAECEENNNLMKNLHELLTDASITIAKALKTSFNPDDF